MNFKKSYKIVYLIGCILVSVKIFYLELDPPRWSLTFYQPVDEQYYVYPALNMYEYGCFFCNDKIAVFGNPWFSNIMTFLTLNIFGDNFYGLRLSSIFFSLLSFSFFFLVLKRVTSNFLIIFLMTLFFGVNYNYTLASTIVEPTISRMAAMLISLYFVIKLGETGLNNRNLLFLGLLSGLMWFFVYPTNAFIPLALLIYIILNFFRSNKLRLTKYFTLQISILFCGMLMAALVWSIFSYTLGENPLYFFERGKYYQNRVGFSLMDIWNNLLSLSRSNLFLLNPLFLFIALFSISFFTFQLTRKKINNISIVIASFFWSIILQSLFINDFPQRKLIILFPLLMLIIAGTLDDIKVKRTNQPYKSFFIYILTLTLCFYLIKINRSSIPFISNWNILLSISVLFAFFPFFLNSKFSNYLMGYIFLILIGFELKNTYRFTLKNPTYNYKEASLKLRSFNDKNFIGGFSMGFRINNNIKPHLNKYLYYGKEDLFLRHIDSLAKSNNRLDFLIDYIDSKELLKDIRFVPYDTLMKKEQTIFVKDWILYKEIR